MKLRKRDRGQEIPQPQPPQQQTTGSRKRSHSASTGAAAPTPASAASQKAAAKPEDKNTRPPATKSQKRGARQQAGKQAVPPQPPAPPAAPPQQHKEQKEPAQPPTKRQRRSGRKEPSNATDPSAPPGATQQPPAAAPQQPTPAAAAAAAPAAKSGAGPSRAAEMAGRPPRPDEDDDMAGNMNSASTALQGLLRKLGAGFDDIMGMGGMPSSGRFKAILTSLRQDDESSQLGALTELCEMLSISSEDTLASFPIESAVPLLVNCLSADHNPDMMLLAARALTFMADVLPVSCGTIVRHGAVPAFCQRLLTIEYIDLAEQSLQALEKLSHEHSRALLQNGGLLAVLSYLDFFPTGVQRVAVTTAANMCRGLTQDSLSMVQEAVPMLTNLLQYQDAKIVDKACITLGHIAEAFGNNAQLLAVLNSSGLVVQALQLIKVTSSGSGSSQLSIGTYYGLVRLLATCVASSSVVSQQLIEGGVLETIRALLSTSSILHSSGAGGSSNVAMLRTSDQLYEVLSLLCHLLPAVPESPRVVSEELPTLQPEDEDGAKANASGGRGSGSAQRGGRGAGRAGGLTGSFSASEGPASAAAAASGGGEKGSKERAKYLQEHTDVMRVVCAELLPLLLQLYAATVMPQVRYQCLSTVIRMLAVLPGNLLEEGLRDVPVSSFVASLLSARDSTAVAYGLHATELLMLKLPKLFRAHFLKEGVVYALEQLAARTLKEEEIEAPDDAKKQDGKGQAEKGEKKEEKKEGESATAAGKAGGSSVPAQNTPAAPTNAAGAQSTDAGGSGGNEWKSATRASSRLNSNRKNAKPTQAPTPTTAAATTTNATAPPTQTAAVAQPSTHPTETQPQTAAGGSGTAAAKKSAATPAAAQTNTAAAAAAPGPPGEGTMAVLRRARDSSAAAAAAAAGGNGAAERSNAAALRAAITRRARAFLAEHFGGGKGETMTPQGIAELRTLCEAFQKDESALRCLFEMISVDCTSSSVSVFELLHSGAVKHLGSHLQALDVPEGSAREEVLLQRLTAFADMAMSSEQAKGPSLSALIHKLQAALAATEAFPVLQSRVSTTPPPSLNRYGGSASAAALAASRSGMGSGRPGANGPAGGAASSMSAGLTALTQPFKLRMCRHPSETSLRDYSANVVLIEPLASMTAIEDFLWPRVQRPAGAPGGPPGTGSASAAAAAGAARNSSRSTAAAGTGTQQGGAAAAGAAAAADTTAGAREQEGGAQEGARGRSGGAWGRPPPPPSKAQSIPGAAAAPAGARRTTRSQSRDSQQGAQQQGGRRSRNSRASYDEEGEDEEAKLGRSMGSGEDGMAAAEQRMLEAMAGDAYDDEDEEGMEDDEDGMPGGLSGLHRESMLGMDEDDEDYDEEMPEDDEDEDHAMGIGSIHVHDLHVADGVPPRGGTAAGTAPPASTSAAPAAAAAPAARPNAWGTNRDAAAAAGDANAPPPPSAASVLASAPPKLIFFLGDQPLSPQSTVFQAIQQQGSASLSSAGPSGRTAAAAGGSSNVEKTGLDAEEAEEEAAAAAASGQAGAAGGRRLWDGTHMLYYRIATAAEALNAGTSQPSTTTSALPPSQQAASLAASAAAAPKATMQRADARAGKGTAKGGGSDSALAPLGTVVPLHEVMSAAEAAQPLNAGDACKEVVTLLGLLEALNRVGGRLCNAVHAEEAAAAAGGATSNVMRGSALVPASGCSTTPAGACASGRPAYVSVPRDEFVSSKLASKLAQQLKDVLAICGGGLPSWCHQLVFNSRHLFPFEMRRRYFYSTAFGLGRALQHLHSLHSAELGGGSAAGEAQGRELRIGRLQRQKVRVSRKRILESAVKVMELYAKHRAVLELEYFGEVGTGLGPTLEFYTLLSHDLQRRNLGMWRHEDAQHLDQKTEGEAMDIDRPEALQGDAPAASSREHTQSRADAAWHDSSPEYVNAPWGLFPLPLPPSQRAPGSKVLEHFRLLGRSIGKALQDNRLMDLPFNYTFYRALLGRPLDLFDIARFDPQLGSQLEKLWAALMAHRHACSTADAAGSGKKGTTQKARNTSNGSAAVGPVKIDGMAVDDLCLSFTLPGQPDFELIPGGSDVTVDSSNLGAWIDAVVDATLGSGIAAQVTACSQGFNEVFALSSLGCFYEDEIETLLCGAGEHWTPQTLLEAIKFDHGYTSSSPVVSSLMEVLSELDLLDQRRFLRFVTGCPRLPPGGLAALQPRLTVVRKQPSGVDSSLQGTTPVGSFKEGVPPGCGTALADGDLPSVMTCANYIKLPPYSSKAVMRDRLLFAVREGQGSFDLS